MTKDSMYNNKNIKKDRLPRSKIFWAAIAVLLLFMGGIVVYAATKDTNPKPVDTATDDDSSAVTDDENINLDPPTEEDKQETEKNKDDLADGTPPPVLPTTPEGKKIVTPEITAATSTEVRADVRGIVEDGGSCTATATKASEETKSATAEGIIGGPDYTICPIPISLPGGGWTVTVTYSSANAEGTSALKVSE